MTDPKPSKLAYIVVIGQITIAIMLVGAICGCLFYKNYSDPTTLAAIMVMAGTLLGNLGSILGGPRQMQQQQGPVEAKITNPTDQPVPVSEQPKP